MQRPRSIVILTGAGISAESGLATFRGPDGLWEGHKVEDVATPEAFARDPRFVHDFYNMRRAALATVQPNPAHLALARLEAELEGDVLVVTQNVDDLHEQAGSRNLIHMHGALGRGWCQACDVRFDWRGDMSVDSRCPRCTAIGFVRPDIVWFGEMPYEMDAINAALGRCDLFVSIGTSGNVYPAAGFVQTVRYHGRAHTLELNLEPSQGANWFAERRHGPAGTLVPMLIDELL